MDVIETAKDLFKADKEGWADPYRLAKEDLHFLSDDEFAQWDQADALARKETGRPAITIDQLGQFIHQVSNDIRMNTPTINVIPGDNRASEETAEVYKGLIKKIEYHSNADDAYDTAVTSSIKCSIGFIRVDHDYSDDHTDKQDLFIRRVINPFSCMIDSSSIEVDGSDAKHGHIIEEMTVDTFKKRFPGQEPVSFEGDGKKPEKLKGEDKISICEFFQIVEEDGETIGSRTLKKRIVKRYTLSGQSILEETTFPGKYIPIVPVYGEEAWQDGKRHLHSLIRKSKGAQRMYNFWKSLETELLQKAPQAPVMAPAGSIENYADDWQNPGKSMVLRYDPEVNGKPVNAPTRLEPPTIPTGIINASREAVDDIKATMGIYNASLGMKSNETSGVAINQRKLEGDVATYHFGDNLVKSICHVGKILVCAIPEIYDTPRIIQVIGEEEEVKQVGINGLNLEDQEQEYNLTEGKYDVRVTTGAPSTTKRQEAMAALQEVFKAAPDLMQVMGDLYFKNADFSGAQAMAKRMEKVIDPKFLEENQDEEKAQMAQALQQAQAQIEQLAQQLQSRQENEQLKAQVEVQKANSEMEQTKIEASVKMAELEVKKQEIALKYQENQVKMAEIQARLAQPQKIEQSGSIQ